ncbi:MAG: tetratricopeptide repeat protein [Bacteroidota bacterium]|nr:tetratricopeptide repeat protein [Bacteroidota bacterium]
MKHLILVSPFLLFPLLAIAQKDHDSFMQEAAALRSKGLYEEAIRKYDSLLVIDKNDYSANYEKSYTFWIMKKYDECIRLSKFILENYKEGSANYAVYIQYGSCLDLTGKPGEALAIYDEGIKKYPATGLLYFNKAITLYGVNRIAEAIETDKLSIMKNPYHASSHHLLSTALGTSNKVYGLLASLTFLAIEPEGERAQYHLANAETLIGLNVKKTGEKTTSITLSFPKEENKDAPDDFHTVEVGMSLSAALNESDKNKKETPVERMYRNLEMVFSSLSTHLGEGKGFGWTYYAAFFSDLYHKEYLNTFCHIIYSSANNAENNKWLENNQAKVNEFNDWFKTYAWNNRN